VADLDPQVLQVDEANLPGHPDEADWAADAVNLVLDAATRAGERGVHLCFGNYGGQAVQKGAYEKLLPFMDALRADHMVLEFARRGYGELESLKELDAHIGVGLGVIDIKDNGVESSDEVARRIEGAERALGEGRVRYVHPDCGFWMLHRTVADAKMRALVEGRDLYEGAQLGQRVGAG
jgi:5-methyltetrahydropteroyltriglutamate--homocysteine methyltransferase